jgi:hypothetical protein
MSTADNGILPGPDLSRIVRAAESSFKPKSGTAL